MTGQLPEATNEIVPILKDFPQKPITCYKQSIFVRDSATDFVYHTSNASYFTYCMGVAEEGAKVGHFRFLKGDLLSHPVELMECLCKGESFPGDEVIVRKMTTI